MVDYVSNRNIIYRVRYLFAFYAKNKLFVQPHVMYDYVQNIYANESKTFK